MNEKKAKQLRREIYGDQSLRQERTYKVVAFKDSVNRTRQRYLEQGLRGKYQAAKRNLKRGRSG